MCGSNCPLPSDTVSRFDENLDLDAEVRESTPIQTQNAADSSAPSGEIIVCEMCHVVRRKELSDRIQISVYHQHRIGCPNL
jgi:hypothetical protein